ncbi:MAG: CDP-alcohol phosphatidyltransferase family protein [Myxococcota bacterium]|nr:CDP-alcohol phosphatidyltransferase family protein [Myxococcota bacterium]
MTLPAADRQPEPTQLTMAWGVHLFTASGAVLGALALVAISAGDLAKASLLMLAALLIDSVDGTLARKVRVSEVLPKINGRRLDDIVDYLNFVIVPVVFMLGAGNLLHWSLAALPIIASAYGFSQEDAKTEDDFFLGWPSYWNVCAIYFWMLGVSPLFSTGLVALFSVAVFVPHKYIYPSKLTVLRNTTAVGGLVWGALLTTAIVKPEFSEPFYLLELSLAYPAYYLALSYWLGNRGPRSRGDSAT